MENRKWEDSSGFLEQFEQARRSLIGNMFCKAVRRGKETVNQILEFVYDDANERYADEDPSTSVAQAMYKLSYAVKSKDHRVGLFAEHILWRESLSWEEKDRLKKEASQPFTEQAMSGKPATETQLELLRKKGITDLPTDRLEASKMISEILGK